MELETMPVASPEGSALWDNDLLIYQGTRLMCKSQVMTILQTWPMQIIKKWQYISVSCGNRFRSRLMTFVSMSCFSNQVWACLFSIFRLGGLLHSIFLIYLSWWLIASQTRSVLINWNGRTNIGIWYFQMVNPGTQTSQCGRRFRQMEEKSISKMCDEWPWEEVTQEPHFVAGL